MAVTNQNYRTLIIIVLALNIIGSTSYGLRERYASLGSEYSELSDNLFIILLAICMLATALLSFVALKSIQLKQRKPIKLAWFFSLLILCLAIIGGVTYEMVRAAIDYIDWWLDTGFYAGIIVGLLSSVFYTVILRRTR
jgi:hypothetical protein